MSITEDTRELNSYIDRKVDIHSVASFKGNEHIIRLKLKFDIKKIREALDAVSANENWNWKFIEPTIKSVRPGIIILCKNTYQIATVKMIYNQ